ncbi:metallophosphoesterase family protein [Methanolobus profundi]|uniref:Phosphoesterase n=1 Tax=Methanolobus profundi TaxID=487685 RepID=A0A1I4Q157_9EURY|nr:metallophosphoesterase family protein [Methanolobus profundi]SFM33393.1 Calcineurin-like phosphoesterase superfamily domain-containing protein [Methanolobus profundi]
MRILLISDIHGNKEALDAVLEVPHDMVICLGDLADYGPSPSECIDLIMQQGIETILGNHDAAVGSGIDCGCGYKYKHLSEATRDYTWKNTTEEQMAFLRQLPFSIEKEADGLKLYFTHGSPRSNYEYIRPETPEEELEEMLSGIDADVVFIGHSHVPFVRTHGDMLIVNPGSTGQPRDEDWHASCAVFDTSSRETELIRLDYDMDSTCRKIEDRMPNADELTAILKRGY